MTRPRRFRLSASSALPAPPRELPVSAFPLTAFDQAYATLAEDHARKELVPEEQASQFADTVQKEIKAAGQN